MHKRLWYQIGERKNTKWLFHLTFLKTSLKIVFSLNGMNKISMETNTIDSLIIHLPFFFFSDVISYLTSSLIGPIRAQHEGITCHAHWTLPHLNSGLQPVNMSEIVNFELNGVLLRTHVQGRQIFLPKDSWCNYLIRDQWLMNTCIKVGWCIEDKETGGTRLVSFIAWLEKEGRKLQCWHFNCRRPVCYSSSGRLTLLQLQSVTLTI